MSGRDRGNRGRGDRGGYDSRGRGGRGRGREDGPGIRGGRGGGRGEGAAAEVFSSDSPSHIDKLPTNLAILGLRIIPSLLLAPKSRKSRISSRKTFLLTDRWASGAFR